MLWNIWDTNNARKNTDVQETKRLQRLKCGSTLAKRNELSYFTTMIVMVKVIALIWNPWSLKHYSKQFHRIHVTIVYVGETWPHSKGKCRQMFPTWSIILDIVSLIYDCSTSWSWSKNRWTWRAWHQKSSKIMGYENGEVFWDEIMHQLTKPSWSKPSWLEVCFYYLWLFLCTTWKVQSDILCSRSFWCYLELQIG